MKFISLEEIKDKLDFFKKMYDVVRLVDPVYKKVIDYQDLVLSETQGVCYDYWKSGRICDNCISIRAYREDRSYVKLEKKKDIVLLVTAIPIENTDSPIVLEVMKNATDTMMIGSGEYNEGELFNCFVREINDMIVRDSLTSLYNRRFVDERLPVDIIDATLKQLPLSVCFMDLDNFKSINDLYGHEVGDSAIKAIGDMILKHIRLEQDWAARYGGDEFLICLNNTDEKRAHTIVERIQNGIEKIPLVQKIQTSNLSVSFGIATMKDTPITAVELIRRADENMYKAKGLKRQTRNK